MIPSNALILKPSDWHPADQAAWSAAVNPGKPPFIPPGRACHWSTGTRYGTEQAVGRFLAWMRDRHGTVMRLSDAYDIIVVRDFLRDLASTASRDTLKTRLEGIGRGLRAIAGRDPREDLLRLRGYLKTLDLGRPPKHADIPLADDLLELGRSLMREAKWPDPTTSDKEALVKFRDGLMIAFLATHPLRIGVFFDLTLERDVLIDGDRVRIRIEAHRQKARRATGGDMKPELVAPFFHYLRVVRPWLLARSRSSERNDRLWITDRGTGIDVSTVDKMLRRRTKTGLGREVGPHKFRHAAATYIAIRAPEKIGIVTCSPRTPPA